MNHIWTIRGPSFASLKDKRGFKERPHGPEGYNYSPPPPRLVISSDPFQVISEGYSLSQFVYLLTLDNTGGFWPGFGIIILIYILSLVFGIVILKFLSVYLNFEGTKKIHVLLVLIWSFGGRWRFLTGIGILILIWIWSLVFDTSILQILNLKLDSEGAKNIHVL